MTNAPSEVASAVAPAGAPEAAPGVTLSAQRLTRRYGARVVVNALDLELRRGEILGFLGPNGAGKSTTMQMLTGTLAPSAGAIRVCGLDILEQPVAAKTHLGYLPETPPLYKELTVREYIDLAAQLHRVAKAARPAAVRHALERCGLAQVGKQLIGTLSKGYQQRVGIAQAIVHNPDIVILDEPTVGLDPHQIRDIRALIRELGQNHSVILSTHILPEVESVCDRVQIIHHGETVFSDTIAGLKQFQSGRRVLLGLRQPPALSALQAIAGIAQVEIAGDRLFRISFADDADPTEALVQQAVNAGWGLTQLTPAQTSLEDVFVHLTTRQDTDISHAQPEAA